MELYQQELLRSWLECVEMNIIQVDIRRTLRHYQPDMQQRTLVNQTYSGNYQQHADAVPYISTSVWMSEQPQVSRQESLLGQRGQEMLCCCKARMSGDWIGPPWNWGVQLLFCSAFLGMSGPNFRAILARRKVVEESSLSVSCIKRLTMTQILYSLPPNSVWQPFQKAWPPIYYTHNFVSFAKKGVK